MISTHCKNERAASAALFHAESTLLSARAIGVVRLLGAVVIALAWLIPNHYPPWTSFYNEACMATGFALLALGIAAQRPATGMPGLAWALLAVAAVPWCQWAAGLLAFSGDAWVASLYLLGFATAVSTGYRAGKVDAQALAATLSVAALTAAAISTLLAMMQVFELGSLGIWIVDIQAGMRAGANMGQSNNLATLLGLGAVALLLLREQGRIGPVGAAALLVLLMVGLSLTQGRIGLLFGPVVWLGLWLAVRRGVGFRTRLREVGVATVVSWLLIWAEPILLRASELASYQSVAERGVKSLRFEVWPILFDGLSLHPWRGYGWLQVGAAELAAADRHPPVGELYLQAHNLFFELVIWCGYPLGLVLGLGVVYWFITRVSRVASIEAVVGMLVVAIAGVHAMLELPYHYAYFLIPVGLWMGLVEASIGAPAVLAPRWQRATTLASLALFVAICWDYPPVEDDFRLVRFELLKVGTLHATQPAPDAPFLSSLTEYLRAARNTPRPGMSPEELDRMRAVVDRYPYAAGMSRYASALALNGRSEEARVMFAKILHIHGKTTYARAKAGLREAALEGPPALHALELSIPP